MKQKRKIQKDSPDFRKASNRYFRQERVRMELRLLIGKLIRDFKSKEEPTYKKLTQEDIIYVLSSMIARKTE